MANSKQIIENFVSNQNQGVELNKEENSELISKTTLDKLLEGKINEVGYKEGIEIQKGFIITQDFLLKNEKLLRRYFNLFCGYPDIFIDLIIPSDSNFTLFFYQRIFLRACFRYQYHYCTACRGFSKTFISILAIILQCIFIPNTKRFICAPGKNQSAKIAAEKVKEIFKLFPLLKNEIIGEGTFGKDYVTLNFWSNSLFDVVGALDSERGGRRNGGLVDEVRDHDGQILNSVVLPLMNVARIALYGEVNPKEPQQQQLFMTSAGTKTSYAYQKLIEIFITSIITPKKAFVWGCDYRIPVMHGLLDMSYIMDLKMSPTYDEKTFAREYLGIWSGAGEDSWFNFDTLESKRVLKNPETHAKFRKDLNQFYLLSVDVGRIHDQTVCCVFKVTIKNNKYITSLVNLFVIGSKGHTKSFYKQCAELKKIIKNFNPKEVVIDTNGLGIGLAEEMTRIQIGDKGEVYPPYAFSNDKEMEKIQPSDAAKILVGIKANSKLNSDIHGNVFSRINGGKVKFLINEQQVKSMILSTKSGQKLSIEKRVSRVMPHEMTSKLFDEMANLKLVRKGLDIALEKINTNYPKDKYSALSYGLWRIKELEEENYSLYNKKAKRLRKQLVFYKGV